MYRSVVIGATGEIGSAVAGAALARGDRVAALDLQAPSEGDYAHHGSIDIRCLDNVRAALAAAAEAIGGIDVLINSAGIMARGTLHDTAEDDFSRVLDVNLGGAFRLTKAVSELMQENGGSIVHISSIHALRGAPDRISYAASKGGITALIHAAASELGPHHITINAVAPGPTGRGMGSNPEDRRRALERIPLQRVAAPEEVADAAMFLTSPAGRFITGHVLPVDGGASSTFFAAPRSKTTILDAIADRPGNPTSIAS